MSTVQKWKKSKNFNQKHYFIMFEIALALFVVMIGIFGVSSMFPVGMSSQKQAIGTSYVTDAAEQLLRLNASYVKNDWNWLKVFANSKPAQNDQGIEWSSSSLFQVSNMQVKPDVDFDSATDSNSGLFLLKQMTLGQENYTTIVRMWKEVSEDENGSIDATIHAEVSWPAEKPYYARDKKVFSLQLSKAPVIAVDDVTYDNSNCIVTKENGGGYSTTLSSVVDNGDSTYTIEFLVDHDGCSDADCPAISQLSIEADSGTYTNAAITGISGTLDLGPTINNESFQGFCLDSASGIGNGVAGTATVSYTLLSSLQDQYVSVLAGSEKLVVSFDVADFEFVLSCQEAAWDEQYGHIAGTFFKHTLVNENGQVKMNNITTVNIDGNVYSPMDKITINSIDSLTMNGDLSAGGWVKVNSITTAVITGDITTEGETINVDPDVTHSGSQTLFGVVENIVLPTLPPPVDSSDPNYAQPITIVSGDYTIDGPVNIEGTIYATGDIHINNGQSISGSGALVSGGGFFLNDINGIVGNDSKLFLYSMADNIQFNNCANVTVNGILYIPDSALSLNNITNIVINGGIYADANTMSGLELNNVNSLTLGSSLDSYVEFIPPGLSELLK